MKKIYFLITILVFSFLSLSTLSSLTYSTNPLVVECSVEGKILDLDDEKIVVQIYSFEILFDKDECPVERGDTYEITYTINDAEDLTLTEDGIFTANVGRFWTTPQPGKAPVLLNWYSIKDSENSTVPLINPQSDVLPIDTQNLDEEDVETTIIDEYTKVVSNRYFD